MLYVLTVMVTHCTILITLTSPETGWTWPPGLTLGGVRNHPLLILRGILYTMLKVCVGSATYKPEIKTHCHVYAVPWRSEPLLELVWFMYTRIIIIIVNNAHQCKL